MSRRSFDSQVKSSIASCQPRHPRLGPFTCDLSPTVCSLDIYSPPSRHFSAWSRLRGSKRQPSEAAASPDGAQCQACPSRPQTSVSISPTDLLSSGLLLLAAPGPQLPLPRWGCSGPASICRPLPVAVAVAVAGPTSSHPLHRPRPRPCRPQPAPQSTPS